VIRLYQTYETYLAPPSMGAMHPVTTPRTDLLSLPYYMREVAEMVDHVRAQITTKAHEDRKETQKTQEMLKTAGVPL